MKLGLISAMFLLTSMESFGDNSPKSVIISDLQYNGSGCRQGDASVIVTNSIPGGENDFFQVVYDNFIAEKGKGIDYSERKKTCRIDLTLDMPQGWSLSVMDTEADGFAEIPKGSSGIVKNTVSFKSSKFNNFKPRSTTSVKYLKGPYEDDYQKKDGFNIGGNIWSPCKKQIKLNLKTVLRLKGPQKDYAQLSMDIQSGLIEQKWHLKWKKCRNFSKPRIKIKKIYTSLYKRYSEIRRR